MPLSCVLHFASCVYPLVFFGSQNLAFACRVTREFFFVNADQGCVLIASAPCLLSNTLSVELIVAVRKKYYVSALR